MIPVIRLNGVGQRIRLDVRADTCLDVAEDVDIAGVPDRVRSDAERTAVSAVETCLDVRLPPEQLVFIHEFGASGDEIFALDRQDRFNQVRIRISLRFRAMVPAPNDA